MVASGGVARGERTPPIDEPSATGPYQYRSVSILGGGFVTGIVFSPLERDLIFARTDIGGAYRWNVDHWMPVTDWVDRARVNWMGIESIAFDPLDPKVVYMAAGMYIGAGAGMMLRSADRGISWEHHGIPVPMGGNADGRSMGERLAVDPRQTNTLYFASRTLGLWRSVDRATSWSRVENFPVTGMANHGLSLVVFAPSRAEDRESTFYVGVAEPQGSTLYRSTDSGRSFESVAGAPSGLLPHHAAFDTEGVLYLAYNDSPGPNGITRGSIWKHVPASGTWADISPPVGGRFGGLAVDQSRPGTLLATSIDVWAPDDIYRTTDAGVSWQALGSRAVFDAQGAEYLRFGGQSISSTGWMGDIEIDPFDSNRALYITGQGIWWSDDVTATDSGMAPRFRFENHGLEETVALDLAVPPAGALLLSAVGDIGGFRHDDLEKPSPHVFKNPVFGNTTSLDFAGAAPDVVARVGTASRGNPRGAYSLDGGTSFSPFASEPAMGRGQGTIAVSADGTRFVWATQSAVPAFSEDRGMTWTPCVGLPIAARVSADRVNPAVFYAVNTAGTEVLVSRDGGATFGLTQDKFPVAVSRPKAVFDHEGDVWIPTGSGLLRSTDAGETFSKLAPVQTAYAVAFGKAAPERDYPAIYVGGMVDYVNGIFRSDDAGASFVRIDDAQHQYGWINHLAADPRLYGRVYLGTSGRGIIYGDPAP
jgi:photosystem II stability/assembly factor-like uncharacterized protein